MRKIESFQMKKIYAIGHALGITGNGSELYKGYNIEEISRNNSLAGKTKTSQFKELIIRNYEK